MPNISNLRLRAHRALSWLDRTEQADDLDGSFIFLWIAFNAAYAAGIDASYAHVRAGNFQGLLRKAVRPGRRQTH